MRFKWTQLHKRELLMPERGSWTRNIIPVILSKDAEKLWMVLTLRTSFKLLFYKLVIKSSLPCPSFSKHSGSKRSCIAHSSCMAQSSYSPFALMNKYLECSNPQSVFIKLSSWYSACSDPMIWTQVSDYEFVLQPLPYNAKMLFQTHSILKDSWYLLQKPLVP